MRWTQAVSLDERTGADGEGVWSWRPDAGAKVVGHDPANDGGKRARSPGRSRISRKTIAQGRPDDPAPPVVTTVCFLPMHTGRGCELAPGLPCALLFSGRMVFLQKLGPIVPRECGCMCSVIARSTCDEAIHSFFLRRDGLLRFARNDD